MKLNSIFEATELFKDSLDIQFDPDSDGLYDIKKKLLPLMVMLAYKSMYLEKQRHEQKHGPSSKDEDAYNFEFTATELLTETESLLSDLADGLKEIRSAEITSTIKSLQSKFAVPLEKK